MGKPFPTSGEERVKAQKPGVPAWSGNREPTQWRTSEFMGNFGGLWKVSWGRGPERHKPRSPWGKALVSGWSQRGNEHTWSASFPFDPEQLCKGRREGCRLGWEGMDPGHPALSWGTLPSS